MTRPACRSCRSRAKASCASRRSTSACAPPGPIDAGAHARRRRRVAGHALRGGQGPLRRPPSRALAPAPRGGRPGVRRRRHGRPSGDHEHEDEDHARMRRLLIPAFSAKRMRRLHDRVAELAEGLVDDLVAAHEAGTDPVDLHAGLLGAAADLRDLRAAGRARRGPRLLQGPLRAHGHDDRRRPGRRPRRVPALHRAGSPRPSAPSRARTSSPTSSPRRRRTRASPTTRVAELPRRAAVRRARDHGQPALLGVLLLLVNPEARDRLLADPEGEVDGIVEEVLRLGRARRDGAAALRAHRRRRGRGRRRGDDPGRRRRRDRHQRGQPRRGRLRRRRRLRPRPRAQPAPVVRPRPALLHRCEPRPHRAARGPGDPVPAPARAARGGRPVPLTLHTERLTGGLDELPVTW